MNSAQRSDDTGGRSALLERIAAIVRNACQRVGAPSLEEVAERSDIPLSVLQKPSLAGSGVTTTQLADLAEILSLDFAGLLQGKKVLRQAPSVFLRHNPIQDYNIADNAVIDDAMEQGRYLVELRHLLGKVAPAMERRVKADQQEPAPQGYRLAQRIRDNIGNLSAPIGDMVGLIESSFCSAVLVRSLHSIGLSALCARSGDASAILLRSFAQPCPGNPLLARVNLAHELCHLLFDPSTEDVNVILDWQEDKQTAAAEQRARAFAAEFLLPKAGLKKVLGTPRQVATHEKAKELVVKARETFETPHELTVNHLCNLKFIDMTLREGLNAKQARGDFEVSTPGNIHLPGDNSSSLAVRQLVEEAHGKGLLTDGEAREMLGLEWNAALPWEGGEL